MSLGVVEGKMELTTWEATMPPEFPEEKTIPMVIAFLSVRSAPFPLHNRVSGADASYKEMVRRSVWKMKVAKGTTRERLEYD